MFWDFQFIKILMRGKITDLFFQPTSTSFEFPAETKFENTKPLVTENQEFQYRDEALELALFGK